MFYATLNEKLDEKDVVQCPVQWLEIHFMMIVHLIEAEYSDKRYNKALDTRKDFITFLVIKVFDTDNVWLLFIA